jgi:hypothetical protein
MKPTFGRLSKSQILRLRDIIREAVPLESGRLNKPLRIGPRLQVNLAVSLLSLAA